MKNIFIVGSINTDLVISTDRIPQSGETLTGNGFFTANGGKGANQAVAAARLGGNVYMFGAVGNDKFGISALNSLKDENVNVDHVKILDDVNTGTAVIIVCNRDNRIILDKGANACVNTDDIDRFLSFAKQGDIFLTQLETPIEVVGYALKKAKEKGMYVVLNPAPANLQIKPYLQYCDLVTPNETEIELLGGEAEISKMVDNLLITLGSKGFKIVNGNTSQVYPCKKVQAVDTTAAGDTLCGGLCASLSNGNSLENSAIYGSKAATIACTRMGAQPSIPYKKELENDK